MLTSSGYSAISPIAPRKVYRTPAGRDTRAQSAQIGSKFDSVTLSTSTGDIDALRQQVADHAYTPDPMAIAARMLMLGEGA